MPTDQPDNEPRSDVQEGHAGTTTEHEVASTTAPGQPTGPTEQADLQGEPSQGDRSPLVTKTGKVLTDADIQALADEAERGYDIGRCAGCGVITAYHHVDADRWLCRACDG